MDTVNYTIRVPKGMAPYLADNESGDDFERNALILYGFIQTGVLSHGRAAEILDVKKQDLIEFYNSKGLPYLIKTRKNCSLIWRRMTESRLNDCHTIFASLISL